MPRLGPSIVRRPGLEEWLGRFKSVPVRFLVAPPGYGKSDGAPWLSAPHGNQRRLLRYSARRATTKRFGVPSPRRSSSRCSSARTKNSCARSRQAPRWSSHSIVTACPTAPGIDAVLALIEDVPDDVALLVACRSRAAFPRRAFRLRRHRGALRRRTSGVRCRRHPPRRRNAAAFRLRTPMCCACSKRPTDGRKSSAVPFVKRPKITARSRKRSNIGARATAISSTSSLPSRSSTFRNTTPTSCSSS